MVKQLEGQVTQFRAWLDDEVLLAEKGRAAEAVAKAKEGDGIRMMGEIQEHVEAMLSAEAIRDRERDQALDWSRLLQTWTLAGAAAMSVLVTLVAVSISHRSITSRLAILANNAERLATGNPLASPIGGRDELARVDQAFHRAAQALAERDRENEMFIYSVSH